MKNHLDHLPWKALEAIVDGEPSPKGIQKQHLEPIIRFLLIELGWREGQPGPLNESNTAMETSMGVLSQDAALSTQNDPSENSSAPIVTKSSQDESVVLTEENSTQNDHLTPAS